MTQTHEHTWFHQKDVFWSTSVVAIFLTGAAIAL